MRLSVQKGEDAGKQFPLTKAVITIGRGSDNDIILQDPQVSRQHAQIRQRGSDFVIVDLGSANGTYVNEVHLTEPRVLQVGDLVRLGATTLGVQAALPEVAMSERPLEAVHRAEQAGRERGPAVKQRPSPGVRRGSRRDTPVIVGGAMAAVAVVAIIVYLGRSAPSAVTLAPTPTSTPTPTFTSTPVPTLTPVPETPTATPLPPTTTATPVILTPTAVQLKGTVTADVLNLRGGPGANYEIVGRLLKGEELEIMARTQAGDWLQVITADGIQGWASARYVAINVSLDAIPIATSIPSVPTVAAPTTTSTPPMAIPTPIVLGNNALFFYGATVTTEGGWMTVVAADDVSHQSAVQLKDGEALLQVRIRLWRAFSSEELGIDKGRVLIIDGEGNQYQPEGRYSFSGSVTVSDQAGKSVTISAERDSAGNHLGYGFYFRVPKSTRGFKFRFHDFPDFDLGYPLP